MTTTESTPGYRTALSSLPEEDNLITTMYRKNYTEQHINPVVHPQPSIPLFIPQHQRCTTILSTDVTSISDNKPPMRIAPMQFTRNILHAGIFSTYRFLIYHARCTGETLVC